MYLPSSFILRYVRAEMSVHALMNELDQKDYRYKKKKKKKKLKIYVQSQWRVVLLWYHIIMAEFHPERATYTTLHNHFS